MKSCFSCRKELTLVSRPGRGDSCPHCGADLKVCLNCRFFDEMVNNECREPSADRVFVKDRANYCEYFEFRDSAQKAADGMSEEALKKLKALFGDFGK